MEEAFVLGMIAGEGSFSVHCVPYDTYRYGIMVQPQFGLVMYEKEVVEAMHDDLGIGIISTVNGTNGRTRHDWRIKKNAEMDRFIDWLDENMTEDFKKTDKYDSYLRWRSIVEDKQSLLKSKDGVKELIERARSVNGGTAKRDPKYSTEELINIVEES